MLEKYLIEHCSPTLASLKTANLFTLCLKTYTNFEEQVHNCNKALEHKGISLIVLRKENHRAWVYVCRKEKLQEDLLKPGAKEFMNQYGYIDTDVDYAINRLAVRLKECQDFPHEIGMFLGYPLGDVIGFIENQGKNCKCVGCWKVYCDECKAKETFAKFEKCKNIYKELWQKGRAITKLTVRNVPQAA